MFDEDPLWNADPECEHDIVESRRGGVKCTKCDGWYCFQMGYHTVHQGKDTRTDEQKEWARELTPEDLHCVITEDDVYRYRIDCRDHMNRHLGCVEYSDFLWIARIKANLLLNRERKNLVEKTKPKKELRIIVK